VLEVHLGVARIVRESPHHVFHVGCRIAAAHVGGTHQLEAAVQPRCRLEDPRRVPDVVGLVEPAADIQREAVDASGLRLLSLFFIGGDLGLPGGIGVALVALIRHHVVSKYHLAPVLGAPMLVRMRRETDGQERENSHRG
jgi:hypothetical protein